MEPKKLLQADYLDIIFDQRNKEYGGYELRKHYNQRVGKAATFLFLGMGALISLSFVTTHPADKPASFTKPNIVCDLHVNEVKIQPRIVPPAMSHPPRPVSTTVLIVPKIAPDKDVPVEKPVTIAGPANALPGNANTSGDSTGIGTEGTGETGNDVLPHILLPPKPVIYAEQMPQFLGDMNAYISSHLRYPEAARAENIEGRVVIQFVVNEDGSVSDAKVVHGIGGGCDEEALRMVNSMPKWKPGKQNGIPVKVFFTLPIKFALI